MPLLRPAGGSARRTAATLAILGAAVLTTVASSYGAPPARAVPALASGAGAMAAGAPRTSPVPAAVPRVGPTAPAVPWADPDPATARVAPSRVPTSCVASAFPLDPRRVPLRRTGPSVGATGHMAVSFARTPFGVAVTRDGRHLRRIEVHVEGLRRKSRDTYVVWAATPSLDDARRLGTLEGAGGSVVGRVPWNQFMVIVTEEASADLERWQGPVLLTGFSPSSRMHTMRGHGIFEPHGAGC